MEQGGLSLQDLEAYLGRHAADVLARKRPLTLAMRRRLHRGLGIAADVLLQ
jgi:HTH-type transcriptional regulator/antitoxin HigA